jgi:hypothetical protein
VLTLDIVLNGATAGDVFHFHLGDMTAVAFQPFLGGAFSSQGDHTLDSGGDACPDGTVTAYGIDPDAAAPSPPAAFCVDYRDSPPEGGGATIVVVAPAVPAVSAWGCAILASILLAAGSLAVRRRRVA